MHFPGLWWVIVWLWQCLCPRGYQDRLRVWQLITSNGSPGASDGIEGAEEGGKQFQILADIINYRHIHHWSRDSDPRAQASNPAELWKVVLRIQSNLDARCLVIVAKLSNATLPRQLRLRHLNFLRTAIIKSVVTKWSHPNNEWVTVMTIAGILGIRW